MKICFLTVAILLCAIQLTATAAQCPETIPGVKQVYWGDMHVHTAYSLDAYSFGTLSTPADAYRFARGKPITMADGSVVKLDRPLDFTAVTDHAEWFDFMYLCTDPGMDAHPDCENLRGNASPTNGINLFVEFVVPSITGAGPQQLERCKGRDEECRKAHISQWQRIRAQANAANEACEFTSFIGYEWSATTNFRHTHRNVIFASETVPDEAFDYLRFPTVQDLFRELDAHCRPADGCDVITIPHNTNMGDGTTFDVEMETDQQLALRTRFERLVEIHQEKGNSECLTPLGATDEADCEFEHRLVKLNQASTRADFNSAEWEHLRGAYVRGLLLRGLRAHRRSGELDQNPLQLGVIGSTDGHAATPGFVNEAAWPGPVFGLGSLDAAMSRIDWNPGGLMAIRAEENTRESLFAAMKRREVYATSGPRINLNFEASPHPLSCENGSSSADIPMGGEFSGSKPYFRVEVSKDQLPIGRIEVIKGSIVDGIFNEQVITLWEGESAFECLAWQDPTFQAGVPTFWYLRVSEAESLRWTAHHCQREDRCGDFPGADSMIRERAWSSPIWYLPRI